MDINKLVSLCGVGENLVWKGHTFLALHIEKLEPNSGFTKSGTCGEITFVCGKLVNVRLVGVVLFIDYLDIPVRRIL